MKPLNIESHGKGYLQSLAKGEFKKDEFDFQKEYFTVTGRRVHNRFDVGANIGHLSQRYRSCFPDSHIPAFEPFPDAYERLKTNTRNFKTHKDEPRFDEI